MNEQGKFHGALKGKLDLRDNKWHKLAGASTPFDWNVGYDIGPVTPIKDQGQSFSCGGQAGAYLEAKLAKNGEKSARYIYSQIYYPGGGTTLRDILNFLVKKGVCAETLVPSYFGDAKTAPSENFMCDRSDNNANADLNAGTAKGLSYAFVSADIDLVAQAIRDNGGAIIEIVGQNNGTWLTPFPVAPLGTQNLWRHFLFADKAKIINGKKYIGVYNSWGTDTGDKGLQWISEAYFRSGHVAQAGTVYEPNAPTITQQKVSIITQLIPLLQWLLNLMQGKTKISI